MVNNLLLIFIYLNLFMNHVISSQVFFLNIISWIGVLYEFYNPVQTALPISLYFSFLKEESGHFCYITLQCFLPSRKSWFFNIFWATFSYTILSVYAFFCFNNFLSKLFLKHSEIRILPDCYEFCLVL